MLVGVGVVFEASSLRFESLNGSFGDGKSCTRQGSARRVAWVCACGSKLDVRLRCVCGRAHRRQRGAGLIEVADSRG